MCCGRPNLTSSKKASSGIVSPDYQSVFNKQQKKSASQNQLWAGIHDHQAKHPATYQQIQKQNQQVQQKSFNTPVHSSLVIKQKRVYR